MHTKSLVAAAVFAIIASPVFAADGGQATAGAASVTSAASTAPVASAAAVSASAQALNLPSVTIPASRSRAEVHAEAVDFVAHYKTMLEVQLELAKN